MGHWTCEGPQMGQWMCEGLQMGQWMREGPQMGQEEHELASAKKTRNDQALLRAWSPILGPCQAGQSDGYGQPGDPGHTVLVSQKTKNEIMIEM